MKTSRTFRRHLLARLLFAAGLATSAAGACNGSSTTSEDGSGGNNTTTPTTSGDTWTAEECFAWPQPLTGGAGGVGGTGGAGGMAVAGAGGANPGGNGGMGGAPLPPCPDKADALPLILQQAVCAQTITEGPTLAMGGNGPECCYTVTEGGCVTGRPYLEDGIARHSPPVHGSADGWHESQASPDVQALDHAQRAALAEAWCADGLMEHASVASFGRFALELLAVGAPAHLVAAAHRAALDEVRHARACLGLAACYAGEPVSPGAFPFDGAVAVSSSVADIAARAAVEGCVGETLAAALAAEQLAHATDPAVRDVLTMIAEDEAQHAELAWATVAWAMRSGGEPVRRAVAQALRGALRAATQDDGSGMPDGDVAYAAHGRLDRAQTLAARERTLREVVLPCMTKLLDEQPSSSAWARA